MFENKLPAFISSLEKNATILRLSKKYMVGRNLGKFEPVPSLKYR